MQTSALSLSSSVFRSVAGRPGRPFAVRLVLAVLLVLSALPLARGQNSSTLTTLYNFSATDGTGYGPVGALVEGRDGNFYGTTTFGGTGGDGGTVFRLTPAGALTTLYNFPAGEGNAYASLTQGSDGNFYGSTASGSSSVFRISPTGAFTTLHTFSGTDGAAPRGALVEGTDGSFYGTTIFGGANNSGTVFRVSPVGAFTTLYSFSRTSGMPYGPDAGLVQGSDGNFYGTTSNRGTVVGGSTVYRITPAGALTTLALFPPNSYIRAKLLLGSDGNFYGVTGSGGSALSGTVFRMTPAGELTTLYTFSGIDGSAPRSLIQGSDGNFYGTTISGGTSYGNFDTVFRITPAGQLTTIHDFNGTDGAFPYLGLVQGSDGNFYGTADGAGANDGGTVFRLTPPSGSVALAASTVNVSAGAGAVTLSVNRTGGSAGAVGINYSTDDGTAAAGVDYQPVSGTLSWADGDTDPKTISVPVIDRGLTSGSTQFFVNLSSPGGGAALGAPLQTGVTILATDAPLDNLLAVTLLSPPADVTLTPNQPVTLDASVDTLANTLANVEFFAVDGAGNSMDLGGYGSQRGQVTWTPATPGDYTLQVVATDTQGNTKQTTSPVHIADSANVGSAPATMLNGGLDRLTVPLNDTVTLTAQALDADGNPLQNAQFFLDGAPLPTTPLTSAASTPGTIRTNADGSLTSTRAASTLSGLIQTNATIAKLEQLLTVVGTNAQGVSVVSNASSLFAKANAGTPPTAAITNLATGAVIPPQTGGQLVSVSADSGSQPLSQVELIVDNRSAGVATSAPYTFKLPALASGSHVISAIATALDSLSQVSNVVAVSVPPPHPAFFSGEAALANGVFYLALPGGNPFGYYSYLDDPAYIFHFDLGYEYLFDANDGTSGLYLYDFASSTFFYTSPTFPFPYLYDFSLNTVLYYYPNPSDPQHYNTNGIRYFYRFDTSTIFSK